MKTALLNILNNERWRKTNLAKAIRNWLTTQPEIIKIEDTDYRKINQLWYIYVNGEQFGEPMLTVDEADRIAKFLWDHRKRICISQS